MSQLVTINVRQEELVVLVDETNTPIGSLPKYQVHTATTPVHRGFSTFLFNPAGQLLLQQRAASKKVWPLIWSNSCCGHPMPGESTIEAAKRRIKQELTVLPKELEILITDYRYQTIKDGILENEFCPVMVGIITDEPTPNPDEVNAIRWVTWKDFQLEVNSQPDHFSPWCKDEVALLLAHKDFIQFHTKLTVS